MVAPNPEPKERGGVKYSLLQKTHEEYDLEYWCELRALYEGGKKLLRNPEVFDRIFPRHANEPVEVWEERKRRAYYVNHLSTVIDMIIAALSCDELRMVPPGSEAGGDEEKLAAELKEWKEYLRDCSPPGGERKSFTELMLDQARTGILLGCAWTLDDLPAAPGVEVRSVAEQREAGLLDVYSIPVAPECVIDWCEESDGRMKWVKTRFISEVQDDPFDDRMMVREEYTIYTESSWARFVVLYDKDQNRQGAIKKPESNDIVPGLAGDHTFRRVPLVRLRMPPGLWAGNKLHSLAIEYLNKSCGLSWAEFKVLFAQLYEFLAASMPGIDQPINEHQEDAKRAERQPRGPGLVQVRGQDDKAAYVAPPTEGFTHAAETVKRLEEAMFRVTYQMALAENNSGALIRRSADSKQIDHDATNIVARAVGKHVRYHAVETIDTASVGRGDRTPDDPGWSATGMEGTEAADPDTLVNREVLLEAASVPSATYQRRRKLRLAKADLGQEATADVVAAIKRELESAITQDQLAMGAGGFGAMGGGAGYLDGDEGDVSDRRPPGRNGRGSRRGADE